MPHVRSLRTETSRSVAIERLAATVLRVPVRRVPATLGIGYDIWDALRGGIDDQEAPVSGHAAALVALHGALRTLGAEEHYLEAMRDVAFPLEAAGIRLGRAIGPTDASREAFDGALGRLRLDQHGLVVRQWAEVEGRAVDWAIAGLLPTGRVVKIAIVVRPPGNLETELLQDLVDDVLAANGFEVLVYRPWQMAWAAAAAQAVGDRLQAMHPHLNLSRRLHDHEDVPPVHRFQATPIATTPRAQSARWSLRESLRRVYPGLGPDALLPYYRSAVLQQTLVSALEDLDEVG